MGNNRELNGWRDDDFVDTLSSEPRESDPWEPYAPSAAGPDPSLPEHLELSFDQNTTIPQPEEDNASDFLDELEDSSQADIWSDSTFDATSDWVEPDPTTDASSELSESLYPPDRTITDITRHLKIGELLANVEPITEEQRARCHALLSACSVRRLSQWIPWLRNRAWCGGKLLLFLEFRRCWESNTNVRWWETFRWDYHQQVWMPMYNRGALTLEHTRELVENRAQCEATNVIDPAWSLEWDEYAPWELGVGSFASFASFRAAVTEGDDWMRLLSRQDQRCHLERAQCADRSYAPFMLPSYTQQYGPPRAATGPLSGGYDVAQVIRSLARAYGDRLLS